MIAVAQESMDWNDMRKFYATVNGARHKTAPVPAICNEWEGNLLADKTLVAVRWKEHYEDLLNSSIEAPRNRITIMDDGEAPQSVPYSTIPSLPFRPCSLSKS